MLHHQNFTLSHADPCLQELPHNALQKELCSIKDHLKCLSVAEERLRGQLSLKSFLFGVKIQKYHLKCDNNFVNKIIGIKS